MNSIDDNLKILRALNDKTYLVKNANTMKRIHRNFSV